MAGAVAGAATGAAHARRERDAGDVCAARQRADRATAEDGYDLWLRYRLVSNATRLVEYRATITRVVVEGAAASPTLRAARMELITGLSGLLGRSIDAGTTLTDGAIVVGTPASSRLIAGTALAATVRPLARDGYAIRATTVRGRHVIVVVGNTNVGALYGAFRLLRQIQTNASLVNLAITDAPRIQLRLLDHWDNLDRSVERGYAGQSLWDWPRLPDSLPVNERARYRDYARANASIGINGAVLTNVNADAKMLTPAYVAKVAALANIFRPYGVRVFLTARFSAPIEMGGLTTADPLDPTVRAWWKATTDRIYQSIPDFGGFLVKANSEGQPGPQDYKRSHADGANMLAEAVAPHGGVVMWRAFVYSNDVPVDRVKQAYDEFTPLDGAFRDNVFVQVKNGPLDFQPREPFHPLFGAMPKTPLMMEFQITKEYLGEDTHLVYLGALFEEVLQSDTWAAGQGSTVARVIDGSLEHHSQYRNCRRGQHRYRSQLDGLALQPGQLVRVRTARLESNSVVGRHRRRLDPHDVLERSSGRPTDQAHDVRVARGRGELHDAARPRAHHGHEPSLRTGAVGGSRTRRLDAGLLSPRGHARTWLQSHRDREQRRRAVLSTGSRPLRQPRFGARGVPALVSSCRLE